MNNMENNYTWHQQGNYAKFRIEESRFGLFTSITEDGERMITALTYDICLRLTPKHQWTKSPEYDGSAHLSTHSGFVGGKL